MEEYWYKANLESIHRLTSNQQRLVKHSRWQRNLQDVRSGLERVEMLTEKVTPYRLDFTNYGGSVLQEAFLAHNGKG